MLPFLTASAAFNFSFLAMAILVPLYLRHLGYSLAAVGLVLAIPGLMQFILRITSGILSDSWGSRRVMLLAFAATSAAGLPLMGPRVGLAGFVVAQVLNGVARGTFWPPAQTYASRTGDPSRSLGRFFSITSVGSVLALFFSGALAQRAGFEVAFAVSAALGLLCVGLSFTFPATGEVTGQRRSFTELLRSMPRIAMRRPFVLAGVIAFLSSTPNILASSFYPVLAVQLGFGMMLATAVVGMRSIGNIAGANVYPSIIKRIGPRTITYVSVALIGVTLLAIPLVRTPPLLVADLLLSGIAGQTANLAYLWLVTENSVPEERGTALSVVGLWWTAAVFVVPPLFGVASDRLGLPTTFLLSGLVFGSMALVAIATLSRSTSRGSLWLPGTGN